MATKNSKHRSSRSVMVAEEHDDASPDDVEPGLLLPQHPAESSSPALPLAPWLVHPGRVNRDCWGAASWRALRHCCWICFFCNGVVKRGHLAGLYRRPRLSHLCRPSHLLVHTINNTLEGAYGPRRTLFHLFRDRGLSVAATCRPSSLP